MDILGMLNDYIKNNKSEEKLASEFASLLNNGFTITKIAEKYNISIDKVNSILKENNFSLNSSTNIWQQKSELLFEETNSGINPSSILDNVNTLIDSSNQVNTEAERRPTQELKLSVDIIVEILNDGVDIETVSKQYNISKDDTKLLLSANGYNYYTFMNFWTKMSKEELCHFLVQELNAGYTLYDLSGKYVKNNKDRVLFVSKVEQLLKSYEYKYVSKEKNWAKNEESNKIALLVEELNKGLALTAVAKTFNTTRSDIRFALKKADYRYDAPFKIWTKEPRQKLVNVLAEELKQGKVSLNQLKEKGYNIRVLESELIKYGFFGNSSKVDDEDITLQELDTNTKELSNKDPEYLEEKNLPQEKETNVELISKEPLIISNEAFNQKEITSLKEMIQYWENRKEKILSNEPKEIKIFIEPSLLERLTEESEKNGVSRSIIINKALKDIFYS